MQQARRRRRAGGRESVSPFRVISLVRGRARECERERQRLSQARVRAGGRKEGGREGRGDYPISVPRLIRGDQSRALPARRQSRSRAHAAVFYTTHDYKQRQEKSACTTTGYYLGSWAAPFSPSCPSSMLGYVSYNTVYIYTREPAMCAGGRELIPLSLSSTLYTCATPSCSTRTRLDALPRTLNSNAPAAREKRIRGHITLTAPAYARANGNGCTARVMLRAIYGVTRTYIGSHYYRELDPGDGR